MRDIDGQDLPELPQCWLTIGAFDGVHVGHQKMIRFLVDGARANNQAAVVLTFHPHPQVALQGITSAYTLTSPTKRAQLLRAMGVDEVITLAFNEDFAKQSAREFIEKLSARLHPSQLVEGRDFALGRDRGGNIEALQSLGVEHHFEVAVIDPVMADGEPVSSSRIRRHVNAGEIGKANRLLGRQHSVMGSIQDIGEHAGWRFIPLPGSLLPPPGNYPARIATLPKMDCMISIGTQVHTLAIPDASLIPTLPGEEREIMFLSGDEE